MTVPEELRYTAEHEWVALDGSVASIGITEHAAEALGDVVYVSPPAVGATVTAGEPCGEIESTKSVSDLYSPVDGEVTEVNADVEEDPGQVNTDPYGTGWIFKVQVSGSPSDLLSAEEYSALIKDDTQS
jgi:glycine cleavage system H protein